MFDPKKKNEKLITYTGKSSCLYTLTEDYLKYLGSGHSGSLQLTLDLSGPLRW